MRKRLERKSGHFNKNPSKKNNTQRLLANSTSFITQIWTKGKKLLLEFDVVRTIWKKESYMIRIFIWCLQLKEKADHNFTKIFSRCFAFLVLFGWFISRDWGKKHSSLATRHGKMKHFIKHYSQKTNDMPQLSWKWFWRVK